MSNTHIEMRREQARRELGTTAVGRTTSVVLTLIFLATIVLPPLAEELARLRAGEGRLALLELPGAVGESFSIWSEQGAIAADLHVLAELDRIETRLEEESQFRRRLLPPVRSWLFSVLGLGTEDVYRGRDGWLFFRPDVDHLTGPGFLDPDWLRARRLGGDAWEPAPEPDPRPALFALRERLASLGIELVVMPTPVKPSLHPERFSGGALDDRVTLRNTSFERFVDELETAGIVVFDPASILERALADGEEAVYLRTDTHWTPRAMDLVAAALAEGLTASIGSEGQAYLEREVAVEGRGDLAGMLALPGDLGVNRPERVDARMVLDRSGATWRPQRGAPVLLLGDSFANVFSDDSLGWGRSAGLAERLSFHLRRPVDRIALNAGGSHAAREELARQLAADKDRLAGTRVVVYQFAARELSFGDWKEVDLGIQLSGL